MSLAPGIMLSLFLANDRVMHSWRQLGKKLYDIHNSGNHGEAEFHRVAALRTENKTHKVNCEECDRQESHLLSNPAVKHDGQSNTERIMNAAVSQGGGHNGPCYSTGCDSQESGIHPTQYTTPRQEYIPRIDNEFNNPYSPLPVDYIQNHHHSFEMLPDSTNAEGNSYSMSGMRYHPLYHQTPSSSYKVGDVVTFNGYYTEDDQHVVHQPLHPLKPGGLQQINYSVSPIRKKTQKKRSRKTQRRVSENRL